MRTRAPNRRRLDVRVAVACGLLAACVLAGLGAVGPVTPGRAQEAGVIETIAQGEAPLPTGEIVWRAVRARAAPGATATFAPRALGFVVAANDLNLVANGATTPLLGGEAAFVPPGEEQQRASLSDAPAVYLAVELVAAAEAGEAGDDATVLEPGQPFPSPGGVRAFELLGGTITSADAFLIPDTGQTNIILVTDGTLLANKPGEPVTSLLAGESATFSGDLEIAGADALPTSFVVAVIGEEVAAPTPPPAPAPTAAPPSVPTVTPRAETEPPPTVPPAPTVPPTDAPPPASTASAGSITIQSLVCPAGMTAERLLPDQCAPATTPFEVTLAGEGLPGPLILVDATQNGTSYTWSALPFGTYRLAQVVPPAGAIEYTIGGVRAAGDPIAGYAIELTADAPVLDIAFYNFVPAP